MLATNATQARVELKKILYSVVSQEQNLKNVTSKSQIPDMIESFKNCSEDTGITNSRI